MTSATQNGGPACSPHRESPCCPFGDQTSRYRDEAECPAVRPQVSFIIPARNEARYIGRCLDSIAALVVPDAVEIVDIIVVDNESTDETAIVASSRSTQVISSPPGCVSRARNIGARAANGQFLAFVDADCELPPNWLVCCLERLQDAGVAAVGTPIAPPACEASWVERCWYSVALRSDKQNADEPTWLPAFNFIIPAETFHKVGGFDESLITCEDYELSSRVRQTGRLVRELRTATRHYGESRTLFEFVQREAWRSRGNLRGVRRSSTLKEWLILLVPPVWMGAALFGVASLLMTFIVNRPVWPWAIATAFVVTLPALILVSRLSAIRPAIASHNFVSFAQCYVLMTAYLAARSIGMFLPVRRIERRSDSPANNSKTNHEPARSTVA